MNKALQKHIKPLLAAGLLLGSTQASATLSPLAQLGKKIFLDANLS